MKEKLEKLGMSYLKFSRYHTSKTKKKTFFKPIIQTTISAVFPYAKKNI